MDRLQKKCFVASLGVHLLLAAILLVGPAFVRKVPPPLDMAVLDFVPSKTVDAMVSGGGSRAARPPPAQPLTQPPAPPQQLVSAPPPPQPKRVEPDPPKDPPSKEEESLEPSTKRHKIEVSTTQVTRKRDTKSDARAKADAAARQQKTWADNQRRLANAIGQTLEHIGSEVSPGASIELPGPGGGGVPYANFLQAVMSAYKRAWSGTVPNDATEEDVSAEASVTIARDGTVISHRITRSSGKPAVDHSVESCLERVKYAAPLPDDAKESQRTVPITFEVKAKRGTA